ncbi:MAG: DMT family transporter [Planctomycetes bacterium]|jgi:drug/metabolite transporter (DMT)-like permease|nr:DMT family transporter [Planctomycetota bacterium]MBT4028111.1 DMT family transporter [Planctomycetota bacterium]MBT4561006.1 DMT family transporter [Planctomycetota bacterium]MBT7317837.1 DMT family transporter [Planctomycetota bacterium]
MFAALPQVSVAPFSGAGELAALMSAVVWASATVMFTIAMNKGARARDAVLFKNMFGAIVLAVLAWFLGAERGGGAAAEGTIGWLLLSGFLGLSLGDLFYFVALAHIGVGRTLILTQITPILTALFAWVLFDETLSAMQWAGAGLVICGSLVAESRRVDRTKADTIGVLAALGCVLTFALGNAFTHDGLIGTGPVTATSWRLVGGALGLLIWPLLTRDWPSLKAPWQGQTWRAFFVPSAVGTWTGMVLMMGGFAWAKQGVAAAMASSTVLFSIPLAVLFLHERPGLRGWLGAGLCVSGVVVMGLAVGS